MIYGVQAAKRDKQPAGTESNRDQSRDWLSLAELITLNAAGAST